MNEREMEQIEKGIEEVNTMLLQELNEGSSIFRDFVAPLVLAGGKKLRARLCLLIGLSQESEREYVILLSSAIELIHLATLVHDDVIDKAPMRRGVPTIHSVADNKTAVLSGDYLFAKAFELIGRTKNSTYLQIFTAVIVSLVEGEFLQMQDIGSLEQSKDHYLYKTQLKTAELISVATEIGARLAHYSDTDIQHFKEFGHSLGMLFQITDDMLDYDGEVGHTGKQKGQDLTEGVLTYPLLSIVTSENKDYVLDEIQAISDGASPTTLADYVCQQGGLANSVALAKEYEEKAHSALRAIPDFAGKGLLEEYLTMLVHRTK